MAQTYTRQSTFADGDTITAALFNDEYNQLVNAFAYSSSSASSTGHRHDGTAGQGGNIHTIGDLDFLNKIVVDSTNNRWGFYVEVSSAAVEQIRLQDGALLPVTDSDIDLGTTSLRFKDTFTDSITTTGNVDVGGNLTVTGTTTFNGGTITMGDAATDNVVFGADVDSSIIPDDDDTYDLGSSSQQWRNIFIDGTAEIDTLALDGTTVTSTAAELNILDGVTSTAAELNILDGVTSTTAELNILDGVTATATELNLLDGVTSTTAELNILDGVTSTAAELNILDGVTSTTAELNILDGVTSTTAELNILDGVTATAAELNLLDGVTATTDELNILDGVTASATDINLIDGITNGTVIASKAIITDANKDISGGRNITITGELDAATLDISGDADIDGTLEADAITIGGVTLAETISDTVGAMVTSNTETGIAVTYDDSDNTLDFVIGTLNQDTTGNAATATALETARTIHGVSFDGTANIDLSEVIQDTVGAMVSSNTESGITVAYQDADGTLDFTVGTLNQDTTGNAATATALETARTIHGVSFDGTANIDLTEVVQDTVGAMFSSNTESGITVDYQDSDGTIDLTVGTLNQNTTGNAATATALETARTIGGVSFDGTANITPTTFTTATFSGDVNVDSGVLFVDVSENKIGVNQTSPDVSLDLGANTDAIHVPVGTTAQRPTGAAGYFRYNSTTGGFEGYTDSWGAIAGGGGGSSSAFAKNTFAGDGSTTAFTLSTSMTSEDGLIVFIDGVYQADNVYSVSGTTLTFATAPVNSRVIEVFQLEGGIVGTAPSIDTMTGDGSDTTLSLSVTPTSENQTFVTIDGVVQHKDTYAVSGSTLTFSAAPPTGTKVECITFSNVSIATFQDADNDTKIQVEESTDEDKIRFDTGGTERVIIDSTGLGIGTSSPSDPLVVSDSGASSVTARLINTNADGNPANLRLQKLSGSPADGDYIGMINVSGENDASEETIFQSIDFIATDVSDGTEDGVIAFRTRGAGSLAERMRIDSSGNVGVGTTSPDTILHAATGSNGSGLIDVARFQNTGTSGNDGARIQLTAGTSTSGAGIGCLGYALNSAHLVFHAGGNNERMRLQQNGDFSIGTTGGSHRFESHSNKVNYASAKILSNTGSGSTEYGVISQLNGDPNNTTNYLYLGGSTSTTRYVVYSNGNVANTNNSYGAYSDVKLKENIVDANPQLEKIKQLQVRNFNLKAEPDKKLIGLVAQEAETIFPKLIDETEDTENDENGAIVKTGETTKSIKYSVFVPVLIKAIQEQQTQIEALQSEINTLKGGE